MRGSSYLLLPIALCRKVVQEGIESPFRLYVYLNLTTSGKLKLQRGLKNEMAKDLGFRTFKSINVNLDRLTELNWIGYDKKNKVIFLRSLDKIRKQEGINSRSAVSVEIEDLEHFKAFLSGALIGWAVKYSKGKEWERARKKGRAMQNSHSFHPSASNGLSRFYGISLSKAHRMKQWAKEAGYIELLSDYEVIANQTTYFNHYKRHSNEGNKLRRSKGKILLQKPDLIFSGMRFKNRKKLKT